ncbi:MAG: AraC family transcriptional regulator [Spirochaetaceae bacterium]|jgi:AraC-like DNA-binding protein|nr:AraC family transcriptional regulator [Spirochaetaceae bacterium]
MDGDTRKTFLHYIPYSEEDERFGMVCTTAGTYEVAPYAAYPPRKNEHPAVFRTVAEGRVLQEFQIVYITKGKGTFQAEGKTHAVQGGDVMLILPGMKHAYKPDFETGWLEYWAGFTGDHFRRLIEKGILSKERTFFHTGSGGTLVPVFDSIMEEIRAQKPLFQLKACAGIFSILAEVLSSERRKEQPNYYQKLTDSAKRFMEKNVLGTIDIPSIAAQIGISASRLNDVFKKYTGMTPYQYFIHIKINKAENLLEDEDVSVQYAAAKLGFDDPYYFSRLFKNKTGISPSKWREFVNAHAPTGN